MSHHFDTPTAREDPRINVNDFYLFDGALGTPAGTTVMAMTVNPDAGLSAPDTFRDEGLYAFRFDLNGDAREELTFKFRFGDIRHANGNEHEHIQDFHVLRAIGEDALHGANGELLLDGDTGSVVTESGIRAFAGLAPELFAGDAAGLKGFMTAFYQDQKYHPDAFLNGHDFFAKRNVSAIVLEVPNQLIGEGTVHAWATASLVGHAPEVQVSRWGLPLITHIFLSDPTQPNLKEDFNRSQPAEDIARFSAPIAQFAEKMANFANSTPNPSEYGKRLARLLCPTTLPYKIGTPAAFDHTGFNGRALGDDVMDIMLTLTANRPLADTATPDRRRIRSEFPYFGQPFMPAEQLDVTPATKPLDKK